MLEQLQKSGLRAERLYLAGIASVGAVFADWLGSKRLEHAGSERVDVSPQLFWCEKCPRELLC